MLQLRPFQKEALSALKMPGHVLCIAPTGSGKSLIYERFIERNPGSKALLITPLLALARQQRERLMKLPNKVILGVGVSREKPPAYEPAIWIASPESLMHPIRHSALELWSPDFLIVDECHCLWEWGEQFRPAFSRIPELLGIGSFHRSLWLTATLPRDARKDLRTRLPSPLTEIGSFELPSELMLQVSRVPWPDRAEALLRWISIQAGAGIVFVSTREATLKLTRILQSIGKNAISYHAGLSNEERQSIENMISQRKTDVIVATSAFGMGMDHAHLRWAALWQAPSTLLSLAQAIGRVGRSSSRANALVLWDDDDFRLIEWTIQGSGRRRRELLEVYRFLHSDSCRRNALKHYFGDRSASETCGKCDYCCHRQTPSTPSVYSEMTGRSVQSERNLLQS